MAIFTTFVVVPVPVVVKISFVPCAVSVQFSVETTVMPPFGVGLNWVAPKPELW
jgi:hypothetical protein